MAEHLSHHYSRSFLGCFGNLVHFLHFHHHLSLRKIKMLTYKRHGNKDSRTDPNAPSTSEQHMCTEDACLLVEKKINYPRKHSSKSSMRILNPKRRSKEHNHQNPKISAPSSGLHRSASIHLRSNDPVHKLNSGEDTLKNDHSTVASTQIQLKEPENYLDPRESLPNNISNGMEVASPLLKDADAKELQEDVILHPSKEFLAMMKLFNGNLELIQKILEDPSFIFAHYLQDRQDSSAEITRTISFPASWHSERKKDVIFGIKRKGLESEYLVNESANFDSDNLPSHPDISYDGTPKEEIMTDDTEMLERCAASQVETSFSSNVLVPSSILQKMKNDPSKSLKVIKQKIKDLIRENKKENQHISMDGILHKIPYGKSASKDIISKSKSGQWEGPALEIYERGGSRNALWKKSSNLVQKSMRRSQSLNDSIQKYSRLFDSISCREFSRLPESLKLMKEDGDTSALKFSTKTLWRIFSLPSIEEHSSSKDVYHEMPLILWSPKNTNFVQREQICDRKETNRSTKEMNAECILNKNGKNSSQQNEQEETEPSIRKEDLVKEAIYYTTTQEKDDSSEACTPDKLKESNSIVRACLSNHNANDQLEIGEIDIASEHKSRYVDLLSCFHLQVPQKYEAEFNYVRQILKDSGFSNNDFLLAWHSPFQPVHPLIFDEVYGSAHAIGLSGTVNDNFLPQLLLFDLINEALVGIYESTVGYVFPWLSCFNAHISPVPTGNHVLEEVWADVYWHLKGQSQQEMLLDDIVSRDFTKSNGWMNLILDSEDVELELEDMILDELLDDFSLLLTGFPASKPSIGLKL